MYDYIYKWYLVSMQRMLKTDFGKGMPELLKFLFVVFFIDAVPVGNAFRSTF